MAELLVFLANNTHADANKDRRGCWKRGMLVVVQEDGHIWGRLESKQVWIAEGNTAASWPQQGHLAILKIPGVPAAKARALLDPQNSDDAGVPVWDEVGEGTLVPATFRRRGWRLVFDSLPNNVRNTVAQTGEFTTTVSAIRNFLRRIRDNAQFTGLD